MSQKRNKIIFLTSFIIVLLFLGIFTIQYFNRSKGVYNKIGDKGNIEHCEQVMNERHGEYTICNITNGFKAYDSKGIETKKIFPKVSLGDTLVISLDMKKIWNKYYMGDKSQDILANQEKSFCFILYPVPILSTNSNYDEKSYNLISHYYDNFKWDIISPYKLIDRDVNVRNIVCTQPNTELKNISFVATLPSTGEFLSLMLSPGVKGKISQKDISQFGVKILSANKEFIENCHKNINFRSNIGDNYSRMTPLMVLKYPII